MDQPFELQDETDVMRRMGLTSGMDQPNACSSEELEAAVSLVPPLMEPFVREMASTGTTGQSSIAMSPNLRIPELPQSVNRQLFGNGKGNLPGSLFALGAENVVGKEEDDDVDLDDEDVDEDDEEMEDEDDEDLEDDEDE